MGSFPEDGRNVGGDLEETKRGLGPFAEGGWHSQATCKLKLDYLNKPGAIVNVDTVNIVTKSLSRVLSQCMQRI